MSSRASKERVRRHIKLDPEAPFSHGVMVGNTLYLSGRIGFDPQTNRVPDEIETEVHFLMQDVRSILATEQMTLDDLVYVQIFCPDVALWERFNAVYREYFSGDLPARAFIGSGKLLFDAHFELQGVAVKADE